MTVIDDHSEEEESTSPRPRRAPRAGGTRPASPASSRRTSRPRCAGWARCSDGQWIVLAFVAVLAIASAVLNVLGPRMLGDATDVIVNGVDQPERHRLRRAAPRAAPSLDAVRRVGAAVDRAPSYLLAGVDPAADAQAPRRRSRTRSTCCRSAYIDKQARGDLLEPRDERHRQRRAEPAADAEPDAHVGAAARRRRDHDVHDLAVAGARRADDRAGVGVRHARRSPSGPGRGSCRSGAARACLNAQIEETFTGHAVVKAFGRQREVEERFRDHQRRALRVVVRRAVHVEPDAAVHDVHGQPPVRDRRGRRRSPGRRTARSASATSRRSSSTRATSRCRSRSWRRR